MPIGACRVAQVLLNSALWLMALSYFCVSMIRTTVSDWSTVFLHESKGLPLAVAARCLFAMETGGFAGSLAAGAISDRCFSGRRGPVVAICSAGLAPALIAILRATEPLTLQMCYAWLGLCAFPVHVLLGLFSREAVPTNVSSSAGGFVKCIAQVRRQALHTYSIRLVALFTPRRETLISVHQVGGAFAGYPLGLVQQRAGWEGVFSLVAVIALVSAASAIPLWAATAHARPMIRARHGTVADFEELKLNKTYVVATPYFGAFSHSTVNAAC